MRHRSSLGARAALAAGALFLAGVRLVGAQDQSAGDSTLDLSACTDLSGQAFAACAAAAGRAQAVEHFGNVAAQTARDLTASCSDRVDSDFGPCIAAAAQALVDDAQQDQTVVAGARELVENCRAQVDADFAQCIADGARAIGQAAANQLSGIRPGLATPSPVEQSAQTTPIVEEPTATPPATATRAIQPVVAPGFPTALRGQQTITPPLQPAPPGLPSPRATQSEPGSPSP